MALSSTRLGIPWEAIYRDENVRSVLLLIPGELDFPEWVFSIEKFKIYNSKGEECLHSLSVG